jgi:hypothetical protein
MYTIDEVGNRIYTLGVRFMIPVCDLELMGDIEKDTRRENHEISTSWCGL